MIRQFALLILLAAVTAGCSDSAEWDSPSPETCSRRKLNGEYIVQWRDGGASRVRTDDIDAWLEHREADVARVEPNYQLARFSAPENRTPISMPELQAALGLDYVWDRAILGAGITIAVIDTGVQIDNPLLRDQLLVNTVERDGQTGIDDDGNGYVDDIHGWNVNTDSGVITDELGHGTAVAGLITGPLRNGASLAIAPAAKVLPVDFIVGEAGTEYDAKKGIDYALARKVKIINNSWSIPCSEFLKQSFRDWAKEDVLFVNAAGNEPIDVTSRGAIPSSLVAENFLNVGSVDRAGNRSSFTGFGTSVRIFALGEELPILRPVASEAQALSSGTSLSAAVVSGAAALVWSTRPELKAKDVVQLLIRGAVLERSRNSRILNVQESIEQARRF